MARETKSKGATDRAAVRAAWLVAAAASACGAACRPKDAAIVCDVDARAFVEAQADLARRGLAAAATDDDVDARRARCRARLDDLKTGPVSCMARCYAKAADRGALFDCDRGCAVKLQE